MAIYRRKPRRSWKNYFWKGVKKYGFKSALKWELTHPRKYPQYSIWFIPLLISMVILAIILYFNSLDYVSYLFYILEIIAVGYMMLRLLKRLNRIRIKGDLMRLWGLRLLSALVSGFGLFIIIYVWITFLIYPLESTLGQKSIMTDIIVFGYQWNTPNIIPLALEVVGLGLCLIGAYLLFKFKMKSGNVIWVGRI